MQSHISMFLCCIILGIQMPARVFADDAKDMIAAFDEAEKLYKEGNLKDAAPLYEKALILAPGVYGEDHEGTATILNNLANLYSDQCKYLEAELLYQRCLNVPVHCSQKVFSVRRSVERAPAMIAEDRTRVCAR